MRYYKNDEQLLAAKSAGDSLNSDIESVVIDYKTDPELSALAVPRVLTPDREGLMRVVFTKINMHIMEGLDVEIGAAVFGVHVEYEGNSGIYYITMPMTTESAVVGGREIYGEPKKIADIQFNKDGDVVTSTVTRQGIPYMEFKGTVGKQLEPGKITDIGYCFKCLPAISGEGFDAAPIMTQLKVERFQENASEMNGELLLNDSPFDPVADLPVREIVSCVYETGTAESSGKVIKTVSEDTLKHVLHQRYDDLASILS